MGDRLGSNERMKRYRPSAVLDSAAPVLPVTSPLSTVVSPRATDQGKNTAKSRPLSAPPKKPQGNTATFDEWLAAKHRREEQAREQERNRRKQLELERIEKERRKRETLREWERLHDARVRERKECERQMKKMEEMHRAEEARRAETHSAQCRQRFRQWLSMKCEENSQSHFTPFSKSHLFSKRSSRASLPPQNAHPRLSLSTFHVSVPPRRRLELTELPAGD